MDRIIIPKTLDMAGSAMADSIRQAGEEIEVTDAMIEAGLWAFFGEALSWDGCSAAEQRTGIAAAFREVLRLWEQKGRPGSAKHSRRT